MFSIDDRLRGLPATREQVLSVFQSINQPHLAIPGKNAGPAQAYIVGLRGAQGFAVFVYLYLAESKDCAVYAPGRRSLSAEEFPVEEANALAFVESMGFMVDNLNFRSLAQPDQEQMLKTLPVFQKDPKGASEAAAKGGAAAKPTPANLLGRLLGSF